jgi:hypothetical protein
VNETPPNRRHDDGPKADSPGIEARKIATVGAHVYSGPGLPGEFLVVWKLRGEGFGPIFKTVVRDRSGAVLRIVGGASRDEAVRVAMNDPELGRRPEVAYLENEPLRTDHTPESIVREPFHVRPLVERPPPGEHVTGEREHYSETLRRELAAPPKKPPFSREGDLTAVLNTLLRAKGASMAIDTLDLTLRGLPGDADAPSNLTRDLATAEVLVRAMLLECTPAPRGVLSTPHHPV